MSFVKIAAQKACRVLTKYAPEILAGAGVAGVVTTCVLVAKETDKAKKVTETFKDSRDALEEIKESDESMTDKDLKKEVTRIYAQASVGYLKAYWPAVTVGTLSVTCLLASTGIMRKRNAVLTSAYVALDRAYDEYRRRVRDRFGDEVEQEIYFNAHKEVFTTINEDGSTTDVEVMCNNETGEIMQSMFKFIFDESNPNFKKGLLYNRTFLTEVEDYLNHKLCHGWNGVVTAYDLFDYMHVDISMFKEEERKMLMTYGWVNGGDATDSVRQIKLGFDDMDDDRDRSFMNGEERNVWLHPNFYNIANKI